MKSAKKSKIRTPISPLRLSTNIQFWCELFPFWDAFNWHSGTPSIGMFIYIYIFIYTYSVYIYIYIYIYIKYTFIIYRYRSEVFYKIRYLKIFAKFTEKHLCQDLFLIKVPALSMAYLIHGHISYILEAS